MLIRRKGSEDSEPEGTAANTYLAMALAAPVERGAERPRITGVSVGDMLPLPVPAWCHDPTGQEPPTGYVVDEVGAALGGAGSEPLHSSGREVSAPKATKGGADGE